MSFESVNTHRRFLHASTHQELDAFFSAVHQRFFAFCNCNFSPNAGNIFGHRILHSIRKTNTYHGKVDQFTSNAEPKLSFQSLPGKESVNSSCLRTIRYL